MSPDQLHYATTAHPLPAIAHQALMDNADWMILGAILILGITSLIYDRKRR